MRYLLTLLLVIVPVFVTAGELRVKIDSLSKICVGDELTVYAKVEDFNASFAVHNVVTTCKVKQGASVVATKTLSQFDLTPLQVKDVVIATGWIATATGNFSVEVSADGTDDINGPQTDTKAFVVCAPSPCPDRPTASSTIIYLGDGATGSVSYSFDKPECCYEIKFTIVTGRDAVTSHSPEQWTKVPPTTNVTVNVNRIKWNNNFIVGRVDWRTCDRSKSGSDYILIRDGTKPAASAPTPQPIGTTAGQTPKAGTEGDPVVTGTREFVSVTQTVDAQVLAELPISMRRDYSSLLSTAVVKDNDFGPGWSYDYDWFAVRGDGEIYINGPSGFCARFRQEGQNWILDWPQDGAYSLASPNDTTLFFGDGNRTHVVGFDKTGRIQFVDNTFGYRNTFNYTGRWFSSITTPSGAGLTFTRDTTGLITRISNGVTSTQYGYTDGILTSFTNGKGNTTQYNYVPGTYFLKSWTTPEGRTPFTNDYDIDGHVIKQDYGDGFTISYANANNVTTMTYPLGITRSHKSDSYNRLLEMTGSTGARASLRYDSRGNRNSITDMEGSVLQRTFSNGKATNAVYPNGAEWGITYKPRTYLGLTFRDVEKVELKNGLSYLFERNPTGTIKSVTEPSGRITTYEYGATSVPFRVKGFNFDNAWTYTLDGLASAMITRDQSSYAYLRNVTGEITEVKKDNATTATFGYDPNGDITSFTNSGITWKYTYDKDRNTVTTTDPLNRNWSLKRDTRNRVTEYLNPIETSVKYGWIGPLMTWVEFAGGVKYSITPNADGIPTSVANPQGDTWTATLNNEGIPTQFTLPGGLKWTYQSNNMGWLTDYTSPLGITTHVDYDNNGLSSSLITADGVGTTTERNAKLTTNKTTVNGTSVSSETSYPDVDERRIRITDGSSNNWTQLTNGMENSIIYTSPLGKEINVLSGSGSGTVIDYGSGLTVETIGGSGRSTGIRSGSDSVTWKYNNAGELVKMGNDTIIRNGAGSITTMNGITASRGPGGRITGFAFDAMPHVTYRHDNRGYVNEVEDKDGGKTTVRTNSRGRITGFDYPGGFKLDYTWSDDDQIMRVATSDGWWMQYVRDEYGRPKEITRSDNIPLDKPYSLDAQYNANGLQVGATYDAFGNYESPSDKEFEFKWKIFGLKSYKSFDGHTWHNLCDDYGCMKSWEGDTVGWMTGEFKHNHLTTNESLFSISIGNSVWDMMGLPNGHLLYGMNNSGGKRYLIDDGQGNIVAERDENGEYVAARAFTPYGVTVGKIGIPGPIGYKGLTGGLTFGSKDELMVFGRNTYSPDFGRYLNSQNPIPNLPLNTDPRTENEQTFTYNPFDWYRPFGMNVNMRDLYQSECSFDGSSLKPRKYEQFTYMFDADPWSSYGRRTYNPNPTNKYDLGLIKDVLKIGYSLPQRTDEVRRAADRLKINIGWNRCYGSGYSWSGFDLKLIVDPYDRSMEEPSDLMEWLYGTEDYSSKKSWWDYILDDFVNSFSPTPQIQPQPNHETLKKK